MQPASSGRGARVWLHAERERGDGRELGGGRKRGRLLVCAGSITPGGVDYGPVYTGESMIMGPSEGMPSVASSAAASATPLPVMPV